MGCRRNQPHIGVCRWPRNRTYGAKILTFQVHDTVVNMDPLRVAAGDLVDQNTVAVHWQRHIDKVFRGGAARISLLAFIEKAIGSKPLTALVAQMLWSISLRVEKKFGAQAQGADGSDPNRMRFEWVDWKTMMTRAQDQDRLLCEYVENGRLECENVIHYGMPNDKGHCNTLPLHTAYLIVPSNIAIMCCPIVGPPSERGLCMW
jgi:hypothetical protein